VNLRRLFFRDHGCGGPRARTLIARAHGSHPRTKQRTLLPALLVALVLATLALPSIVRAATLPAGFQDSVVFSGLTQSTDIAFALDGRVFVAEKSGLIEVFDHLSALVRRRPGPGLAASASSRELLAALVAKRRVLSGRG
jgi:hypothetical protein